MGLTQLQESVFEEVKNRLDSKYPGKEIGICCDLFKREKNLGDDLKIQKLGFEKAVEMVYDDSLYWAGYFTGTPGF